MNEKTKNGEWPMQTEEGKLKGKKKEKKRMGKRSKGNFVTLVDDNDVSKRVKFSTSKR